MFKKFFLGDLFVGRSRIMATSSTSNNFFLYFAVLLCIIQSGISITLALLGLQVQECKISILQNRDIKSFESTSWLEIIFLWTYLTYFRNKCSGLRLEDGWSDRVLSVHRTYKWILVYLIMGTIWMFISFSLFIVVLGRKNRNGLNCYGFLYSWIIITMIVVCTDLLASVQYILDVRHSSDPKQYFEFIGYKGNSSDNYFRGMTERDFFIAPVVMSLIFSRGITFWILNVVFLIHAFKRQHIFEKKHNVVTTLATPTNNLDQIQIAEKSEDTSSQSSLSHTVLSTQDNNNEPSYVPWVNVLYIPLTHEDNVEQVTEHYDEHHYEHVTGPNEIPGAINIEIPQGSSNNGLLYRIPSFQKPWIEPALMRIDIGNISVQISQKNNHECFLPAKFSNLRVVRLPKLTKCSDTFCSSCNSTDEIHLQ